ncbi:UNVERIFIED_CONTAM: hypothetical protein GTU68_018161 [Idotea baltica]|nr:hypothetical protein [Idotea baltica]
MPEPRRAWANYRYPLNEIIVVALCATIANCETWDEIEDFGNERLEWFEQYLELQHGIPSHDTIARVISALDTAKFFECLQEWVTQLQLDIQGKGIHIDGKTARRTFDHKNNKKALHMVSAWVDEHKVCLGQLATEEKSNEITAIPMLLELLNIKGGVVTLDAAGCQEKITKVIIAQEADYVITAKDNQPKLVQAIAEQFSKYEDNEYKDREVRSTRTKSRSRGRIQEQVVTVAPVPDSIKSMKKWQGIKTIGMVYRHREAINKDNPRAIKESDNVTYFISSLPPTASKVAKHVNKHWTVENSLHWSLDVTFTEDKSRIRKGNSPEIMASLRRFVLTLLKRDTSMPKKSMKRKRKIAAMNSNSLAAILFGG